MLVVRQFLESLIEKYGKHSIYLDGGTWYPEACRKVLKLKHYIDSSLEKSSHVYNCIELIVSLYNNTI
jgi:putative transposase